jgi:DNA mismatch endonuclease (patch repair protein)
MSRQRTVNTKPEVALRSALHKRGVRYQLHRRDLPGRPDIVLVRARLAIFVDGCFWHACPLDYTPPKSNSEWWAAKLRANVERDRRVDEALLNLGWEPLHVWEHEDADAAADVVSLRWRASARRDNLYEPHPATAGLPADRHRSDSGHTPQDATG